MKTPDVWNAVIHGGLIAMIAGMIGAKLSQRFPGKTFYQYSQVIVGKWVGRLLSLFLVIYLIAVAAFEVRAMAEVTKLFLLQNTLSR